MNVQPSLNVGASVTAGQQIGTHVGDQTWSDIAVWEGDRLLSYFEVMTDAVFPAYRARGIEPATTSSSPEAPATPTCCPETARPSGVREASRTGST